VSLTAALLAALFFAVPGLVDILGANPIYILAIIVATGVSLPVFLFVFLINNLYKRQTLRFRYRHTALIIKSIFLSALVLLPLVVIFAWDFFTTWGRVSILYFVVLAWIGTSFVRLLVVKYIVNPLGSASRRRKMLVIGGDAAARKVANAMQQDPQAAFVIVGFVDDYKEKGETIFDEWKNLGHLNDLGSILKTVSPDEILIAIDNAPYSRLVNIVECCLDTGRVVRVFSDRLQVIAERLGAELYAEGVPVIMLSQVRPSRLDRSVRRLIDVVLSLLILTILLPLLLLVVVGIKLSSSGPSIFRQTRIGFGGQPFEFYKFRSMHEDKSPDQHQDFVEKFIKGEAEESGDIKEIQVFKIRDDPRIFPFGRFIRASSLDEFPQLINVLKGNMGLVGPRPCLPYEWDAYDDWHKDRLSVLPGCTGLWQVLGRSTVTFEDMVLMDLYYISNYSLVQDVRILYKTIPAIFFSKGGY